MNFSVNSVTEITGHCAVAQIDNHRFADRCIDRLIAGLAILTCGDFELLRFASDVHGGAHA